MEKAGREMTKYTQEVFDRYLKIIGVKRSEPSWENLEELSSAHLKRIPFENVSKIHQVRIKEIRGIPKLTDYLDNIERHNLGGTCYTNNYYLHLLLRDLGYTVRICGADIAVEGAPTNGHMLNVVTIDGHEAIVDVGYGAPFWRPIPRDSSDDFEQKLGYDRYVFKPQDNQGRTRLEMYRENQLVHGYLVKPEGRILEDFDEVIARSYTDKAPFINRLIIARFLEDSALVLRNSTFFEMNQTGEIISRLDARNDIIELIAAKFGFTPTIAREALETLGDEVLFAK